MANAYNRTMDDDDRAWLERAARPREPRNENDRRLMEFGHDPWLIEWFLTLTPGQRLDSAQVMANFALAKRRSLGIT